MSVVTRRIGTTIEVRHQDAPIFDAAQSRQVLTETARRFFELALQDLAGFIAEEAPVGVTGHLAQSFGGSTGDGGTQIVGHTLEDLEGRVFSSLPYAIVMNDGRAPGARMPPSSALIPWVQRVLNVGGSPEEIEAVAFVVARAIGRKGIKGRHFVEAGVDRWTPRGEQLFAAMGEAMAAALVLPGGGSVTPGAGGTGL